MSTKDTWSLGGHEFTSRFILGSGKFSLDLVKACIEKADAQIITLALRRANEGGLANILDYIPENVTLLPNTSGARNAQGAGNIASALFGGIPATGAIARTAANIKNGGRTPIAGMVHSVTLIIVLVVLMPYAGMIPMPTIAAILFIVAYNMCQWRTFRDLVRTAPKSDILVLIVTFVLTVIFDLVVAIEIGMVLACLLFIKRMSEETHADSWVYTDDDTPDIDKHLQKLPLQIRVYEITGPLFFGAADAIEHIVVKDFTRCLVLRMRGVPALDSTAMNALQNLVKTCESKGITLVFSHVNEQPMHVMEKAGFVELVGKENFQSNISAALKRAEEVI